MTPFVFASSTDEIRDESALLVEVPGGVLEKQYLLAWYAEALRFPDYFGWNWDALYECLRDLSWIKEHKVIIYHQDVPLEGSKSDQEIYVDLLVNVIKESRLLGGREVIAVFDPACEGALRTYEGR